MQHEQDDRELTDEELDQVAGGLALAWNRSLRREV